LLFCNVCNVTCLVHFAAHPIHVSRVDENIAM
jgi:hypothetical protein